MSATSLLLPVAQYTALTYHRVCGQVGGQVCLDTNGTHTRATTTVRDAEGLVQVQVAHISTNDARGSEPNLQEDR